MQEEAKQKAGLLLGIHRRRRLKEDPGGGWTQDQFILDALTGEAICSRMTLYKLEQGQGIQMKIGWSCFYENLMKHR